MDLFGVQELPNSKSISAPGYAFVPDLGPHSSTTAASRKRGARKELSSTAGERTAASDAKILRELAALDKESARDVVIPVPIRARDGAGRGELINNSFTLVCRHGCHGGNGCNAREPQLI